jgi:cytidine deaminase
MAVRTKSKKTAADSKAQLKALLNQASKAARNSYSPYSGFKVGSALLLNNGEIVTGTNVESVSYGLTICAERSALVSAVSRFGKNVRVKAVAVTNLNGGASPPCGACLQMLSEFIDKDTPVIFPAVDGLRTVTFVELLPQAFGIKLK